MFSRFHLRVQHTFAITLSLVLSMKGGGDANNWCQLTYEQEVTLQNRER